jgi:hypothetical protein
MTMMFLSRFTGARDGGGDPMRRAARARGTLSAISFPALVVPGIHVN